jgi:hypothetical protein
MNYGSISDREDRPNEKGTTHFAGHVGCESSSDANAHSSSRQNARGIPDPVFLCDIPADILSSILERAGMPWNLLACRASHRMKSIATVNIDGLVALDLSVSPW